MKEAHIQQLNTVGSGQKGTIVAVKGGRGIHERLASMGLHVGSDVEMIQGGRHGIPYMLAVGDTRLAIGRGMAKHIIVAVADQERSPAFFSLKRFHKRWFRPFCRRVHSI